MSTLDRVGELESPVPILRPYEKPSIEDLGTLVDLTHMPDNGLGYETDGGPS